MSLTAIILAAAMAASPAAEVAFDELATGDAAAAVTKLEAGSVDDPAVLINLGTAYARQGSTDKALAAFRAAIASPERYDLELADGTWVDSRVLARTALARLQRSTAQAAR